MLYDGEILFSLEYRLHWYIYKNINISWIVKECISIEIVCINTSASNFNKWINASC